MPVMLDASSYYRWLSDPRETACDPGVPYSDEAMAIVS